MYDQTLLLCEVEEWAQASKLAREAFVDAVKRAKAAGVTNQRLADSAGLTEGGIRMLLKRS